MTLGGHIFSRDALRLDYCLEASINSLLPICDEVLVVDCGSADGTVEMLREKFSSNPKVRLVFDHPWDSINGYHGERLRIIANDCIGMLKSDWQFMLQADEVLHERSYPTIQRIVKENRVPSVVCRRIDLWGDVNRCLWLDIDKYPQSKRPMEPKLARLARRNVHAISDAGELWRPAGTVDESNNITIYHYSMVRDPIVLNRKIVEMHTWYHGGPPGEDSIVRQWLEADKPFDHHVWKEDSDLQPIPYPHPEAAREWVAKHSPPEIEGWFDFKDVEAYRSLAACCAGNSIVEVGSWKGKSACSIAKLCRDQGTKLYCVDHWRGSTEHQHLFDELPNLYDDFIANVTRLGFLNDPIVPIRLKSIDAAQWFKERGIKPQLVFIDATHEYEQVREDIIAWSSVVDPDGMIAGHDYGPGWKGVIQATAELVPECHPNYKDSNIWWSHAREIRKP